MANKGMKGIKRLTMKDRHKLSSRLEAVLNINSADGTADYKPGHSDATIGKEFDMLENTVASNRRNIFGNYSSKAKVKKVSAEEFDTLMGRLVEAMTRIERLEVNVSDLQNERSIRLGPERSEPVRKVG